MTTPRLLLGIAMLVGLPALAVAQISTSNPFEGAKPVAYGYAEDTPFRAQLAKYFEEKLAPVPDSRLEPNIGIATVDLNGDGATEVIARLENAGLCGARGCETHLFQYTSTGWTQVFTMSVQEISVAETSTAGYRDLIMNRDSLWRWNGSSYQLSE